MYRYRIGAFRVFLALVFTIVVCKPSLAGSEEVDLIQSDLFGDVHYSRYNFTDLKRPYNGVDGWVEIKFSYWLDKGKYGPYLSLVPVTTSESDFWWQRNASLLAGLQYYPFQESYNEYLKGLRLFVLAAGRHYYDKPDSVDPIEDDIQVGVDFFSDNLIERGGRALVTVAWSNLSWRKTNFSLDDYKGIQWLGNVKVGPKIRTESGNMTFLPYALADWSYSPKYDERWWENNLRLGGGVRWYPLISESGNEISKRFHIYAEALHNAAWLGDSPVRPVKDTDFRIGFGVTTDGFLGM